jgi:hypothetical protein
MTHITNRDWKFSTDGDLDGLYVETRQVTTRDGETKAVADFHLAANDELVTVWPATVLKNKLRRELRQRRKADFEPGERIQIRQLPEKKDGPKGAYTTSTSPSNTRRRSRAPRSCSAPAPSPSPSSSPSLNPN